MPLQRGGGLTQPDLPPPECIACACAGPNPMQVAKAAERAVKRAALLKEALVQNELTDAKKAQERALAIVAAKAARSVALETDGETLPPPVAKPKMSVRSAPPVSNDVSPLAMPPLFMQSRATMSHFQIGLARPGPT